MQLKKPINFCTLCCYQLKLYAIYMITQREGRFFFFKAVFCIIAFITFFQFWKQDRNFLYKLHKYQGCKIVQLQYCSRTWNRVISENVNLARQIHFRMDIKPEAITYNWSLPSHFFFLPFLSSSPLFSFLISALFSSFFHKTIIVQRLRCFQ